MRICIDLDGVICEIKRPGDSYSELKAKPGAVEKIKELREEGHYIIIHTARHMKTCDGNVSKVIARQGKTTLDWLEKHSIEYDEILFGKPWADIYIDDNAFRFDSWSKIDGKGASLPSSSESVANNE